MFPAALLAAGCFGLVDEGRLPPFRHYPPSVTRPSIALTDFGGIADGSTNNQAAFKRAFAHCDTLPTGCTLALPPTAPGVPSVYRTSAINLTSRLDLVIPANVTLRATETDADNWGEGWPTLLHSSAPSPCAGTPGNCGCGPAKQSWIHAYNVTNVSVGGGGTIHVRLLSIACCPAPNVKDYLAGSLYAGRWTVLVVRAREPSAWASAVAACNEGAWLHYYAGTPKRHKGDGFVADLSTTHVAHCRKSERAIV